MPSVFHSNQAQQHLQQRMKEAENTIRASQARARLFGFASNLFIFGQYIVGGVLAAASTNITHPHMVVLGAIVAISSVVNQVYHPDAVAKEAEQRAAKLHAMLRDTEDDIVKIMDMPEAERDKEFTALAKRLTAIMNLSDLTSIQPVQVSEETEPNKSRAATA